MLNIHNYRGKGWKELGLSLCLKTEGKSLNSNRLSSVSLLKLLFVDIPYF